MNLCPKTQHGLYIAGAISVLALAWGRFHMFPIHSLGFVMFPLQTSIHCHILPVRNTAKRFFK